MGTQTLGYETPKEIRIEVIAAAPTRAVTKSYQWVMLALATLVAIATFPGQTIGVSAFNEPMRQAIGLTHTQFGFSYMMGTLLGAIPLAGLGMLADRYGLKKAILGAFVGTAIACVIAGVARSWLAIFVSFWLLRMIGGGFLSLLSANTLAYWFDRRLGLAEGIRLLGFSIGLALLPGLNLFLIHSLGWRKVWMVFALFLLVVCAPCIALFFRNRSLEEGPTDSGDQISPRLGGLTVSQAWRTPAFWGLVFLHVWWGMLGTAIAFNAVPLMLDRHLREADGALLMQVFALTLGVMHLVAGMLVDRIKPRWLLGIAVLCMAWSAHLLSVVDSKWMVCVCGITMGVGQACSMGIGSVLCTRFFGRAHLGTIRGSISSVTMACSGLGPLMFGQMYDQFGSFQQVLWFSMIMSLIALTCVPFIRKPVMPNAEPVAN